MELTVIGTGSQGNAYLLDNGEEALLIECGVKFHQIQQAINFDIGRIAGCIVTHEDGDHIKSILDVVRYGIPVYASKGTLSSACVDGNIVKAGEQFKVGGFTIVPFDVVHDAAEPFGYLIHHKECGKVLFLTDTCYSKYRFKGLNNILIEANYTKDIIDRKMLGTDMEFLRNRILKSHMSLETCKELLYANDMTGVNNIVLIHMSDSNSDSERFVREVKECTGVFNVHAGTNGLKINFNKTSF